MSHDLVHLAEPSTQEGAFQLIDHLLGEQQLLTPVARFSHAKEQGGLPARTKYYQDLIPLTLPADGQQYAFAVDLDACTGCKACVTACHSLNGLDEEETWRDVGLLFGGTSADPIQQPVTTACHHCLDPACMNGCPVNAYEKDPVTGIVRHLDDQCIGCQYCILKCPYDVPKYSRKRGIVRKCDMCSQRLSVGEAPACVQACPNEAIRITIVDKARIAREGKKNILLPGAPDSDYTLPSTQYQTGRKLPRNLLPGDFYRIKPEPAHLPLVVMLVLTQLSVGGFLAAIALRLLYPSDLVAALTPFHSLVALALGLLALGASTLHLGRPLYAWRAFIGLKTSWLSREIVVFGLFALFALIYAATPWLPPVTRFLDVPLLHRFSFSELRNVLGAAVTITGLTGVFCSIMIYRDTRREFWCGAITSLKFVGTTLVLGPATILFSMLLQSVFAHGVAAQALFQQIVHLLCGFVAAATTGKLLWELTMFLHLRDADRSIMKRTALLMRDPLRGATISRFVVGALGGVILPVAGLLGCLDVGTAAGILALSLLGELLERYLFFRAVVPPKMPGGIPS
jgi:Fe-S-cluster-containing dehydrogenase component/DMSO reductase anchor subunit